MPEALDEQAIAEVDAVAEVIVAAVNVATAMRQATDGDTPILVVPHALGLALNAALLKLQATEAGRMLAAGEIGVAGGGGEPSTDPMERFRALVPMDA